MHEIYLDFYALSLWNFHVQARYVEENEIHCNLNFLNSQNASPSHEERGRAIEIEEEGEKNMSMRHWKFKAEMEKN